MQVLLGDVGVVPLNVLLESAGRRIVLDPDDLSAHDPFQPMEDSAGTKPFERIHPSGSVAQADSVVIPVRKAEPEHKTPRGLDAQCVNQLFAQQPHGRGTENDDALLVQPDDALIRTEIEHLGEIEGLQRDRLRFRTFSHMTCEASF